MTIFTCENTFESMLTCIYEAWNSKLGHKNIYLQAEPIGNYELFASYRHVPSDSQKAGKVSKAICQKISLYTYEIIYHCAMSDQADKLDLIYRFLLLGFTYKKDILSMEQNPHIKACLVLHQKVVNESHKFIEFIRFFELTNQVLFAKISPKSQILSLIAPHFHNRMPSLTWIIYDESYHCLLIQEKNKNYYFRQVSEKEEEKIQTLHARQDNFQELWKEFFHTIAIKERINSKRQQNFLPLWLRKNMTEFLP